MLHLNRYCNKKPRFICDYCDYKTYLKENLIYHIQAKHLPRDSNFNKCGKCGKTYSWKPDLRKHLKKCGSPKKSKNETLIAVPNKAKSSNKCEKCGKNYSQRRYMLRHSKLCGQPKDGKRPQMLFSCAHCDYGTDYKHHLSDHINSKHVPRHLNLNKCDKCGKKYAVRGHAFRTHVKICGRSEDYVHSLKNFSCADCEYKAYFKTVLADHILVNHLPRDHIANYCQKCGKRILCRKTFRRHSKTCTI